MSDAGEGLVDAEARLQEQMDAREHDRKRRGPKVEDPEKHRATESLKLARADMERQLVLTVGLAYQVKASIPPLIPTKDRIVGIAGGKQNLQ